MLRVKNAEMSLFFNEMSLFFNEMSIFLSGVILTVDTYEHSLPKCTRMPVWLFLCIGAVHTTKHGERQFFLKLKNGVNLESKQ